MEKKMTKRALQAQETKQKIYRCGAELFRKHGYQNVSVEQIAQAAGVGIAVSLLSLQGRPVRRGVHPGR